MQSNSLLVECQRNYLKQNYSIAYDRMRGLAEAYNKKLEENNYDFSVLGRPNLGTACSAVYFPPEFTFINNGILCRNTDFTTGIKMSNLIEISAENGEGPPFNNPYIVELYPEKGYPSLIIMDFELLGEPLEGINSEGLAVVHLSDDESQEKYTMEAAMGCSVGLNELKCIQFLLDTCSDVNQAKEALLMNKHHYLMNPVHLLIADRHGQSFVWEYSHAHNKEYIIDGNRKPQIVTNFLLHRYNTLNDIPKNNNEFYCYYNRYRTIHDEIQKNPEKISMEEIKKSLSLVSFQKERFSPDTLPPLNSARTIYNSIYNCNDRSLDIAFHMGDKEDDNSEDERTYSEYLHFQLKP